MSGKIKKGYNNANPDRGLQSLPGATKKDRQRDASPRLRVTGKYISANYNRFTITLSILGYITACATALIMIFRTLSAALEKTDRIASALPAFVIGFLLVHCCVIFTEAISSHEIPRVRKSIKVFWTGCLISVLMAVIL